VAGPNPWAFTAAIHPFESNPSVTFNRPHADASVPGPTSLVSTAPISRPRPNFAENARQTCAETRRVTGLSQLDAAVYLAHCYRRASRREYTEAPVTEGGEPK
jgi:hypothetical protein